MEWELLARLAGEMGQRETVEWLETAGSVEVVGPWALAGAAGWKELDMLKWAYEEKVSSDRTLMCRDWMHGSDVRSRVIAGTVTTH